MNPTFSAWLEYINTLHPRKVDLGLQRITQLAQSLELTQFACSVITVAGTNGKGSIVRLLESMYLAAHYHVAAYTSPHILRFNERLRINGKEVSDADLMAAFTFIEQARGEQTLSFFEFTTLSVLYLCRQLELDVLLLEVGLGGRLDAVNIVDPNIAVISNIALDHTEWLGTDRESIAREKAGIIRDGIPVICGDEDPPRSLLQAAAHNPLQLVGKDFTFSKQGSDLWDWSGPNTYYTQLPLPHLKLVNAATSLMVVEQWQARLPLLRSAIVSGLAQADLAGRFEVTTIPYRGQNTLTVIYDVAHNPQATRYLAEQLCVTPCHGQTRAIVGMLGDKDIANSVGNLLSYVDYWYVGSLQMDRGAPAEQISTALAARGIKTWYNFSSLEVALKQALNDCWQHDRLLVFGSFYTVAAIKQSLIGLQHDERI